MKYTVTDLGPIDHHEPGADVTGLYDEDTLAMLIDAGYIVADSQKPTKKTSKRKKATDDGS